MSTKARHNSGPRSEYPLPADVANALRATSAPKASNFGLLFHRFIDYPNYANAKTSGMAWELRGKDKAKLWNDLLKGATHIFSQEHMRELHDALRERRELLEKACCARFKPAGVKAFTLEIEWRLAMGLSTGSALDTGMSLHRVYGVPWIASSAIKGATRSYALEMMANMLDLPRLTPEEIKKRRQSKDIESRLTLWERLENLLLGSAEDFKQGWPGLVQSSKLPRVCESAEELTSAAGDLDSIATKFRKIFGTPQDQGRVVFFDAMPESLVVENKSGKKPLLELDIINPHYSDYYRDGRSPPADYLAPIPVNFLTVRGGARFRFLLASHSSTLAKTARDWLKAAAQDIGMGAKTMAGYGALKTPSAEEKS